MNSSTDYDERLLQQRLDDLEISVRTAYALQQLGLIYVIDLVRMTEAELLSSKTLSPSSLHEIKDYLDQMGLALGLQIG